ncbi:MAG: HAD family phosphatase [Lachnospiraceae bacterium]|nr:HAD family phosphatase [Lachnospiraceae bacterium]
MKKYKNIVFDVGGVLLEYRWRAMFTDYGLSLDEADRIGHEMFECPEKIWSRFDLGIETDEEIIEDFEKIYPSDKKPIRWFIEHGEYMHTPRPKVWDMVHRLKEAGYHLYILSNYPETLFHKHTEYADFMKDMDGMMVSYMIHKAKPGREIYEALCEKYSLDPAESIFFDDRAENVQGAIDFGMDSERVTDEESFILRLNEFLK